MVAIRKRIIFSGGVANPTPRTTSTVRRVRVLVPSLGELPPTRNPGHGTNVTAREYYSKEQLGTRQLQVKVRQLYYVLLINDWTAS